MNRSKASEIKKYFPIIEDGLSKETQQIIDEFAWDLWGEELKASLKKHPTHGSLDRKNDPTKTND